MGVDPDTTTSSAPLFLHMEQIALVRRRMKGDTVHVSTVTRATEEVVEEALVHERIEVEHVAIGRQVDGVPAVREEGDITIVPVLKRSFSSKNGSSSRKRRESAASVSMPTRYIQSATVSASNT